jgi:hypothetical protein
MADVQQNKEGTWVIHLGDTSQPEDNRQYFWEAQMRERASTFAKILVIAITLFSLGPQLGSIDVDGDGIPDVPVVVTHVSSHLNLHLLRRNGRLKIVPVREMSVWRLPRNDSQLFPRKLVIGPLGYNAQLANPLRC